MGHSRMYDLLNLAHVPRWGVVPTSRPQSVAEHSFNVAVIALEIAGKLKLQHSSILMTAMLALQHDVAESETGDLPSTLKSYIPPHVLRSVEEVCCPWLTARPYTPTEIVIVKIADKIEAIMYNSRWGVGPRARYAERRDRAICDERIREARQRFGWTDLPDIVDGLFSSLDQSYSESVESYPAAARRSAHPQPPQPPAPSSGPSPAPSSERKLP